MAMASSKIYDLIRSLGTLTHWVGTNNLLNLGSGDGLLPNCTKLLPEPKLTYHQWSPEVFTCFSKLTFIGSHDGLLLGWHLAIIWTNAGILLIQT